MRRLAWALLALVVLLVASAAFVPAWIDWTAHRDRIEAAVKEASGLDLKIDGDISIELLPQPTIRLQEVVWAQEAGDIVTVPQIDASLRLDRVLLGEARAEVLTLIAPQLVAGREAPLLEGAARLLRSPLLGDLDHIEVLSADWRFAADQRLVIDRLLVEQRERAGAISYEVDLIGEVWQQSLVLRGRVHGFGRCQGPLTLEAEIGELLARASFAGSWSCGDEGVALAGKLETSGPDLLTALAFAADPLSEGPEKVAPRLAFVAKTPIAWKDHVLAMPELSLSAGPLEAAADLALALAKGSRLTGALRLPLLDLDAVEAEGARALAEAFGALLRRRLDLATLAIALDAWTFRGAALGPASAEIVLQEDAYALTGLKLALPGASKVVLEGQFGLAADAPMNGAFELASENLRSLLLWVGVAETVLPEERLRRFHLSGRSEGRKSELHLSALDLTLDALEGRGSATLAWSQAKGRPKLDLELASGTLNLDAYGGRALLAVLQDLRPSLDGRFALTFEEVTLAGRSVRGVKLEAHSLAEDVIVDRLHIADFFGGQLKGRGRIDGEQAAVELELALTGPASGLPADLVGVPQSALAVLGGYQAEFSLVGPAASPAIAGQMNALGGQLFFSGLWSDEPEDRGDWAITLQHPDIAVLARQLGLGIAPTKEVAAALDLSGLLRFDEEWSLAEVSGQVGPLTLRQGSASAAQRLVTLALGRLDTRLWRLEGDADLVALPSELPALVGQVRLSAMEVVGSGWSLANLSLDLEGSGSGDLSASLSVEADTGRLAATAVMTAEDALTLKAELADWPLAPFLPSLPDLASPYGRVDATLAVTASGSSPTTLLATADGMLEAKGETGLRLTDAELANADHGTLGRRLLTAVTGDAASGLARIANLTAGLGRLLQGITGRNFELGLSLTMAEGRLTIDQAQLSAADMTVAAEGWLDFAAWQGDYGWSVTFTEQGTAYFRERREGPLDAPNILRDGLLFRGATPPG